MLPVLRHWLLCSEQGIYSVILKSIVGACSIQEFFFTFYVSLSFLPASSPQPPAPPPLPLMPKHGTRTICEDRALALGGGGNSPYERGGDARRLAQGYTFQILVSLRVSWAKRRHIQPRRSPLGLHAKKYKNIYNVCVLTLSPLEVKNSLGPAQIGLLQGFNSKFPTSIPIPVINGVPPGAPTSV